MKKSPHRIPWEIRDPKVEPPLDLSDCAAPPPEAAMPRPVGAKPLEGMM